MSRTKFLFCNKCCKWADLPDGFNETKTFGQHVVCGSIMFLSFGDPIEDFAFREIDKCSDVRLVRQ